MSKEIRELQAYIPNALRFTGERIARTRPRTYRKIVALLAAQVPVLQIATECRVSRHSVDAIAAKNSETIAQRKDNLAGLMFRVAEGAGEQIENALATGKIPLSSLPVVAGIATDKALALSDQPTARISLEVSGQVDIALQFQKLTETIARAVTVSPDAPPEAERPLLPSTAPS